MSQASAAESLCPRCGQTFGCGVALQHCWCHDVQLTAAAIADLRARYKACLCPACLREWATAAERYPDEETATRSGMPPVVAGSGSEVDQA